MIINFIHQIINILIKPKREDFLQFLPKHSVCAEIGVFKGEFTKHILKITQPKKIHLIDGWWKLYGEYFPWKTCFTNFGILKTKEAYEEAKKIVERFDKNKAGIFHIENDLECLKTFKNNYFDWVYLDSSHDYDHTKKELEILRYKIKDEGLITGHDWISNPKARHYGVFLAITEFCQKYNWEVIRLDKFQQWCIKKI